MLLAEYVQPAFSAPVPLASSRRFPPALASRLRSAAVGFVRHLRPRTNAVMLFAECLQPAHLDYNSKMPTIRSRGRLPHWEADSAIYFVTFRLADSVPQSVVQAYEFERQDIIATTRRKCIHAC